MAIFNEGFGDTESFDPEIRDRQAAEAEAHAKALGFSGAKDAGDWVRDKLGVSDEFTVAFPTSSTENA